jgi:hypothetical protein
MAVLYSTKNTKYDRVSSVVVHIGPTQPTATFPGVEMEYIHLLQEYIFLKNIVHSYEILTS